MFVSLLNVVHINFTFLILKTVAANQQQHMITSHSMENYLSTYLVTLSCYAYLCGGGQDGLDSTS